MRSNTTKKNCVSESRKVRKPLMEKKRRARINDSLESLKQILLESKTIIQSPQQKKTAKLEKADILEMTVNYLQQLRHKLGQIQRDLPIKTKQDSFPNRNGFKIGVTLIPTKLENGEIAFVLPSSPLQKTNHQAKEFCINVSENVWRPW